MSIGHNYSVIAKKEDGGWMLPVAIDRVPHSDNKFDFSMIYVDDRSRLSCIMQKS